MLGFGSELARWFDSTAENHDDDVLPRRAPSVGVLIIGLVATGASFASLSGAFWSPGPRTVVVGLVAFTLSTLLVVHPFVLRHADRRGMAPVPRPMPGFLWTALLYSVVVAASAAASLVVALYNYGDHRAVTTSGVWPYLAVVSGALVLAALAAGFYANAYARSTALTGGSEARDAVWRRLLTVAFASGGVALVLVISLVPAAIGSGAYLPLAAVAVLAVVSVVCMFSNAEAVWGFNVSVEQAEEGGPADGPETSVMGT